MMSDGKKWTWLIAPALVLALGACAPEDDMAEGDFDTGEEMADIRDDAAEWGQQDERDDAQRPTSRGTDAAGVANLTLRQSSHYGEFVARSDGRPLYMFTADQQGEPSTCYDACAEAWPPVVGEARPGPGMDESLLGTVARDDGTQQVTYNGWPLYEFFRDSGTEPTGQDIESFGGEWYLIGPDGEQVDVEPPEGQQAAPAGEGQPQQQEQPQP